MFTLFCGFWVLISLFVSYDVFPDYFDDDFWYFTFWLPWLLVLIVGPLITIATQLLYSYLIGRFILKE